MRRKGIYDRAKMLSAAFVVLLLVPSCSNVPDSPSPQTSPEPRTRQQAAAREHMSKEQTVRSDMTVTDRLIRQQSQRDAGQLVRRAAADSQWNRSLKGELSRYRKQHPELVAVAWISGSKRNNITEGFLPNGMDEASPHWAKARFRVVQGKAYESPPFTHNGRSYFVLGTPVPGRRGEGMAALISASVVQEVERHQKRNLRLIPYPAEGRYRIESARPNTTKDATVRTGEDNGNVSHYSTDEVVVKFRQPLKAQELLRFRKQLNLTVVRHSNGTYVFRSKSHRAEDLLAYFRKLNPVYAEPHYLYLTNAAEGQPGQGEFVPNDTLYSRYQWNLPQIAAEQGWNLSKGSQDIVVAVIDTGVQSDHPDLKGRLVPGINLVDPAKGPEDDVGHGTHVAGIIAAQVNNNEGVAGLTWYTKIMPVKALDSTGAGSTYTVAQGVIWAVDHGADVINMSLGNYAEAQFLHDAIRYATDKGAVIVAASGNDNTERPGYPAAYPEVLAVSATDPGGGKAEYSNYGSYIDVAAPGTSIASTYPGSRYAALSGTSMACPHVAALASLVRAANPGLTNAEVMDVLRQSAKDLGDRGQDPVYGYGEIDIGSALRAAGSPAASLQLYPAQVRRELESALGHK